MSSAMNPSASTSDDVLPSVAPQSSKCNYTATSIQHPARYIFTQADMELFRHSPARRELLAFATALGRSCTLTSSSPDPSYDPSNPLLGLSPAMASLHGSLQCMALTWTKQIPPDEKARARFGNPSFRVWHERLVERSHRIIESTLDNCQKSCVAGKCIEEREQGKVSKTDTVTEIKENTTFESIRAAAQAGYQAAAWSTTSKLDVTTAAGQGLSKGQDPDQSTRNDNGDHCNPRKAIIFELAAYFESSFGHPTRIDYGTGHESSFLVFLYALGKVGCFECDNDGKGMLAMSSSSLRPIALSIFTQYLKVTRSVQVDYILEPAGTHGVWGLDDYHCLPFYFGACQLIDNAENVKPSSIHNIDLLNTYHERYMYLGCIRYIKSLKKNAPFFESSPMLNDISGLPSWKKASSGLIRLYEGEVLDKLPVVQHFVFGDNFQATWTPSQKPRLPPTQTFTLSTSNVADGCVASRACNTPATSQAHPSQPRSDGVGCSIIPPPTRAPWAKKE